MTECQTRLKDEAGDRHITIVRVSEELKRIELCPTCNNLLELSWDDNDKLTRQCKCCDFYEEEI